MFICTELTKIHFHWGITGDKTREVYNQFELQRLKKLHKENI